MIPRNWRKCVTDFFVNLVGGTIRDEPSKLTDGNPRIASFNQLEVRDVNGVAMPILQSFTTVTPVYIEDQEGNVEDVVNEPVTRRHSFATDPELCKRAASLGGRSVPPEKRSFSRNPQLASEAGRKGAAALAAKRAARKQQESKPEA